MKEIPFANALAFVSGTVSVVCLLGITFAKDTFIALVNSFAHGIDLVALPVKEVTISSAVTGLITIIAAAWVLGYLFAYCYNWCSKKFAK